MAKCVPNSSISMESPCFTSRLIGCMCYSSLFNVFELSMPFLCFPRSKIKDLLCILATGKSTKSPCYFLWQQKRGGPNCWLYVLPSWVNDLSALGLPAICFVEQPFYLDSQNEYFICELQSKKSCRMKNIRFNQSTYNKEYKINQILLLNI